VISSDTTICTGDILILNALASKDPAGDLLKYDWIFDDGQTLEGVSISKVWRKCGVYQVTLKVTDNSGLPCNTSFDSKLITVKESPLAYAGVDITTCVNTPVYFDGTKSTDVDGVVDAYDWDFEDGEFGSGAKVAHIYKKAGKYEVKLIVTGSPSSQCDNKGYDELFVNVKEGPMATFSVKDSIAKGETLYLDASGSMAYEGSIISYEWDFGDGSSSFGKSTSHVFDKAGNYTVRLKIKTDSESECNETMAFKNVFVNEKPVAVAGNDISVAAFESFILDASKSFDKDGNISEYRWDFSTGETKYGKIINHSFSQSGKFSAILTVTDNTKISNNQTSDTLIINVNAPPNSLIKSVNEAYEKSILEFDGSGSYDPENDNISFEWFINNQKIEINKNKISHKFFFPGKYTIKLIVKDDSGYESSFSIYNKSIEIIELPKISIGNDTIICMGERLEITPLISSRLISNPYLEWKVNGELVSVAKDLNHKFSKPGNYILTIDLFDKYYSSEPISSDTISVFVKKGVRNIKLPDVVEFIGAANDGVFFDVTDLFSDISGLSFTWEFGDKNVGYGAKVFHIYSKPGDYNVTLQIDDGLKSNCSVSLAKFKVTIKSR